MLPDDLFHPDHIIPASEFVTALIKFTDQTIPDMCMVILAVAGQILILYLRHTDACLHIQDSHSPAHSLQRAVQLSSHTTAAQIFLYINGSLHSPVISCPLMKRSDISIAQNRSVPLCDQIRVFL